MRNMILMLGAVLWLGALSPEIFVDAGAGCIFDEKGNVLDRDDAREFMESYFFDENETELKFKLGIMEFF